MEGVKKHDTELRVTLFGLLGGQDAATLMMTVKSGVKLSSRQKEIRKSKQKQ